jgi:hypothetical protein
MSAAVAWSYTQARLQARYGDYLDEHAWQQLQGAMEFPAYLDRAQSTGLRRWVASFCATSPVHELELGLRHHWHATVDEVARWSPSPWRPALLWVRHLVDLPAWAYLRQGHPALPWMHQDPALRPYLESPGVQRGTGLDELAAWASAGKAAQQPVTAWEQEWRRRWPRSSAAAAAQLDELGALLESHRDAFSSALPQEAWALRADLQDRLRARFRRYQQQPGAAFSYLALVALELERLRAELVSRALFSRPGAAS